MAVPAAKDIIAHSFSSVAASMHSKALFDKKKEMVKMYRENGMAEEATAMIAEMAALIRAVQELMAKGPPAGINATMMQQMLQIFPGSSTVVPTTPILMTPRHPHHDSTSFPVPAARAAVAPPQASAMESEEEEEEEDFDEQEDEEESPWLLAGREHLRRSSW
jgi:hypothetical protein